jgi:hypothetical protein
MPAHRTSEYLPYQYSTFATMYRCNVGVKWGVDLEEVATRFLRPEVTSMPAAGTTW